MAIIPVFDDDPVLAPSQTGTVTAPSLVNEFGLETVLIDGYPIDAVVSEKHDFDLEVTEYPVEKGADITDHVRPKPLKISLECFVSDAPFGPIANHPTRVIGTPSSDVYHNLEVLRNNPRPITVVTSLKSYDSMVLSKVSFPRNSGEAIGLRFTCDFTKVLIVQDTRVSIAAAITPKAAKLSPVTTTITAGVDCYRIAGGLDFNGNAADLESQPGFLGADPDGFYFISGPSTPPATGRWINSVQAPDVVGQNQILMSHSLPLLHQGYNPYAANPALVSSIVDFVPQTTQTTTRSNAPVSSSPGDVDQDAIDDAYSPPNSSSNQNETIGIPTTNGGVF